MSNDEKVYLLGIGDNEEIINTTLVGTFFQIITAEGEHRASHQVVSVVEEPANTAQEAQAASEAESEAETDEPFFGIVETAQGVSINWFSPAWQDWVEISNYFPDKDLPNCDWPECEATALYVRSDSVHLNNACGRHKRLTQRLVNVEPEAPNYTEVTYHMPPPPFRPTAPFRMDYQGSFIRVQQAGYTWMWEAGIWRTVHGEG